ncbi:MAG: ArsA family ATPase [Candidatus Limnocylindrales bacterium]
MPRILFFTGKGGVGKTSVAAATAVRCAARGLRTVVISTDIAHSLGDAFDRELGPDPTEVAPNLWAHESDVQHELARSWGTVQAYIEDVFKWRGIDDILAEEMSVLPGMDEIAGLLRIADHHDSGKYDVIVVDAAPTGETLRLLSLPEAAKWWLEKILPLQQKLTKVAGPIVRRMIGMPMPGDAVFAQGQRLFHELEHMHSLLIDSEKTSIRIVLNLEKMVIKEAQRSFTYFHLYGYATDLAIVNRLLPVDPGAYFAAWQDAQQRYLPMVTEAFAPVPVRTIPFFDHEVVGVEMLGKLAVALYGADDPTTVFHHGSPYKVTREVTGYSLKIELPFASKDTVGLTRNADELVVSVGTWRRNLILPRALTSAPTLGAKFDASTLTIQFGMPTHSATGGT